MAHKAADGTAGMHGQSDTLQNEPQACVLRIGGCVYSQLEIADMEIGGLLRQQPVHMVRWWSLVGLT